MFKHTIPSIFPLIAPDVTWKVKTNDKVLYLTFDDGPRPVLTEMINTVLKEHDVKASFFFIGSQVELYPKEAKDIYLSGHTIGNHSYAHVHFEYESEEFIKEDVAKSQLIFYEKIGVLPSLFRSPYGRFEPVETYKQHFLHMIHWNIDTRDWDALQSEEEIIKNVLSNLKPGSIILLHETDKTLKLLPILISKIKTEGYELVSLDEAFKRNSLRNRKPVKFWSKFQKVNF
jgi:peptidoglycan/xylan/chitin deacetylase (PgdA/CDA1 family)